MNLKSVIMSKKEKSSKPPVAKPMGDGDGSPCGEKPSTPPLGANPGTWVCQGNTWVWKERIGG
jgi:hypothetical protein